MTTIAKVFIVLNFVLSVFFVGVASTLLYKADNYRAKLEDETSAHNKTKADRAAEVQKLNTELSTAQTSVDSATRASQDSSRERDALKAEKTTSDTKVAQLQNTVAGFETSLKDLQSTLQSLRETNEQLKKTTDESVTAQNSAADKQAEAEAEVTRKNDALNDANEQIAALQKQITDAGEKIKTYENMLAMAKQNGTDIESLVGPPPINGTVVRSDPTLSLCIVSVGKDDGMKKGYPVQIFRGPNFVGTGVVDEVYQDLSSIRIRRLAPNMKVQANDEVTTRL
jgi:uncharacterized phage infection (PIP) family protein YhgE